MAEENEPRKPRRVWNWARRVIVWLFLLQVVLVVAVLIYAAYWNRRGPRELAAAIQRCRDRALLEDRRSVYSRAAGGNKLGATLPVAFANSPDSTGRYKAPPHFRLLGRQKPEDVGRATPLLAERMGRYLGSGLAWEGESSPARFGEQGRATPLLAESRAEVIRLLR